MVIDLFEQFAYSASVTKLAQNEIDIFLNHVPCVTVTLAELLASGNYKEHCYVEPCNQPQTQWEVALTQATKLLVESGPSENFYSTYLYIKNFDGDEIPSGVTVITNQLFRFGISQRSVLLEQIDYLAKGIESAMILAAQADAENQANSLVSNWLTSNISRESLRVLEKGAKSDIWYDANHHNDMDAASLIEDVQNAMSEISHTLNNAITNVKLD
jgi:hypothetical protein